MSLREQIDVILGSQIACHNIAELAPMFGTSKSETLRTIERNSRVVDVPGVIAGTYKPSGPCLWLVSDCRGGYLVQLLEGLVKI